MKSLSLIFGIFFALLIFNCAKQIEGACLEFNKVKDTATGISRYELIFRETDKIVAKRIFQNGRTLLSEGEIPEDLRNVVVVKIIRPEISHKKSSKRGIIYIKNGKVIAKRIFEDGKTSSEGEIPDGIIIERYENGKIRNFFIHCGGTRNGPALGLYLSGKMKLEATFKYGYPDGIQRIYYKNGNLMVESKMINRKNIYYKEYFENGKLKEEVSYKGDKIIRKTYDINGNLQDY